MVVMVVLASVDVAGVVGGRGRQLETGSWIDITFVRACGVWCRMVSDAVREDQPAGRAEWPRYLFFLIHVPGSARTLTLTESTLAGSLHPRKMFQKR
jgi:hypothetical protein